METWEMLARGKKGDKGDTGEPGPRGLSKLSRSATYAIAGVLAASLIIAGCGLFLGFRGVEQAHHSIELAQRALAVTRHHNALCTAIAALVAVPPPAGNPALNPARAYDQEQHAIFNHLHGKFGC